MKRILVLTVALAMGVAHAGTIQLDHQTIRPTGANEVGEKLVEVSGTCGAAKVSFAQVRLVDGEPRADDRAVLTIKGPKKSLKTDQSGRFFLDSTNTLACVKAPKGPMLVLAAWCTARNCPEVNYQVVDAITIRQLLLRKGAEGQKGEYHSQRQKGTDKACSF